MRPTNQTTPGTSNRITVHENDKYVVQVGLPPGTPEMPDPIDAYLIINKETGVVESWHGILPYAKQNADLFAEMLKPVEKKEAQEKPAFSFN